MIVVVDISKEIYSENPLFSHRRQCYLGPAFRIFTAVARCTNQREIRDSHTPYIALHSYLNHPSPAYVVPSSTLTFTMRHITFTTHILNVWRQISLQLSERLLGGIQNGSQVYNNFKHSIYSSVLICLDPQNPLVHT